MSVLGAVCHDLRDTPRREPFVVAEEVGFEPTVAIHHNGFRDRPIRPL